MSDSHSKLAVVHAFHDFITITNMVHVSMERELNKLFNYTNYNKENVIIREI